VDTGTHAGDVRTHGDTERTRGRVTERIREKERQMGVSRPNVKHSIYRPNWCHANIKLPPWHTDVCDNQAVIRSATLRGQVCLVKPSCRRGSAFDIEDLGSC
jgi:hypothetical protein